MTKNKTIYVALRMNELEVSKLDYIRKPGETRSAAIRRLVTDAWADAMMEQDKENGYPSISDRVNCL
ncbi:MAG: hypothetical protein KGM99_18670 [Burkholderiales bacterium]|nr:hypothetical protein [Burkholderiales bacterium]